MIRMLNFSYTEFKVRLMKSSVSELDLCNKPILLVSILEGKFQKWFLALQYIRKYIDNILLLCNNWTVNSVPLRRKEYRSKPWQQIIWFEKRKRSKLSNYRKLSSRPVNKRQKITNLAKLATSMSLLLACNDEKRGKAEKIVFPQAPTGNGSCALFVIWSCLPWWAGPRFEMTLTNWMVSNFQRQRIYGRSNSLYFTVSPANKSRHWANSKVLLSKMTHKRSGQVSGKQA